MTMTTDKISTKARSGNNFVRSTPTVAELGNSTRSSITSDLNTGHHEVTNSKSNRGAGVIDASAMSSAAVFGQHAEHVFGKLGSRGGKAKEGMDISSLVGGGSRKGTQTQVKGEAKGTTNSRDTADDVSAIDWATVPGIGSSMGSFNKNSSSTTVTGSNGDSFVQEPVEAFDTNSFMVATRSNMEINVKKGAHRFKNTFESAAIINHNKTTKADFEEDILNKQAR